MSTLVIFFFFFFNDTATTEIYTLSLHDALPILLQGRVAAERRNRPGDDDERLGEDDGHHVRRVEPQRNERLLALADSASPQDRKSTRLNSSHLVISYAVFCLKKKK